MSIIDDRGLQAIIERLQPTVPRGERKHRTGDLIMGALIAFPELESPSSWTLPTVLTPDRIERISRLNTASRKLRDLGYHITEEDPLPDDEGSPIIHINLVDMGPPSEKLRSVCAVKNHNSGIERVTIDGVRVSWRMEQA